MNRTLGVDFGSKRVGVAISDPLRLTAQPLEVIPRALAVDRIAALVEEYGVDEVVVGMPTSLSGGDGSESAALSRHFAEQIAEASGVAIVYVDERFTSRIAENALLESGMRRRERRQRVDKVAAAIILQGYLDGNFRAAGDVEQGGAR